jgi:hypothetical protein
MHAPEFEASLAEARPFPELWRLALGLGLILLMWTGTSALIIAGAVGVVATRDGIFGVMPWLTALGTPSAPGQTLVLLATFSGLFLGVLVAAAALHRRGPGTLFGPFRDWLRGFLVTLGVLAPVYAVLIGLSIGFDQPVPNLPLGRWLALLPLTVLFLLIQTGAEELLFRGYLMQQLAVRFRARWVWMWLPAVVFMLLHWNPEAGANLPLVLLSALTFGLVAADLTERTGNLGAAMGLHFGNNFVGLAVVSISNTITGLALYVTSLDVSATGVQSLSLALSILVLLGVWAISAWILDR